MKYIALLTIVSLLGFALSANAQSDRVYQDLKNYVDSIENIPGNTFDAKWDGLNARYKSLMANVDKKSADYTDEMAHKYKALDKRFKKLKKQARSSRKQDLDSEANDRLMKAERWYDDYRENAEFQIDLTGHSLEKGWEETRDWFSRNYDNLKQETRIRYDALKRKIDTN